MKAQSRYRGINLAKEDCDNDSDELSQQDTEALELKDLEMKLIIKQDPKAKG